MTVTALDAQSALLVIDLQKGIAGLASVHPIADITARAAALAHAFRRHALPVVLVNVAGPPHGRTERPPRIGVFPPGFTDLLPELDRQPTDHTVTKHCRSAFSGTDLAAWLHERGVTQVVIAGVSTSAGVEGTARQAYDLGFNVTLAIDAMTDHSEAVHAHSIGAIFPGLGETGTTQDIVALLDARGHPA